MAVSRKSHRLYEFGRFSISSDERVLLKDGQVVQLTPKALDLLLVLVERRGSLVEKEELMRMVWPDTFVEEANLSNNVSLLRKALAVDEEHQYIETVPRRGYRFVAEVSESADGSMELVLEGRTRESLTFEVSSLEQTDTVSPKEGRRYRLGWRMLVAAVGLLAVAYTVFHFWPERAAPQNRIKMIAVLPFKPLVADYHDEALEMGMTETLITRLSTIKEIGVRSTSAVRKYNAMEQDPVMAGGEQKVDAVLDGYIQKMAGRVRVTVRLLRVSDGHTLWADKLDARLEDIFTLQDSIAERAVAAMAIKLTGEQRQLLTRHYTDNAEAYQFYLKGRLLFFQWTEESAKKSLECFDAATTLDPNYALAYTGKADVYAAYSSHLLAPAAAMLKAKEAVQKALQLDDQLAEGHRLTARIKQWADWDWVGAEREFRQSIDIEPNAAYTHICYGEFLYEQKRFDESLAEFQRAREIEPLSPSPTYNLACLFYYTRQYDKAIESFREVLTLSPNFEAAHRGLGCAFRGKGMCEEAIDELRRAIELNQLDHFVSELGYTYAFCGWRAEAMKVAKKLEDLSRQRYVSPFRIARIYVGLGEKDRVFKWLQNAYEDRSAHLLKLGVDPTFDGVRNDPRFRDLLGRIGLSQ